MLSELFRKIESQANLASVEVQKIIDEKNGAVDETVVSPLINGSKLKKTTHLRETKEEVLFEQENKELQAAIDRILDAIV